MLSLDPITRAEYDAAETLSSRAAVVMAAITGTVTATVYDGSDVARGSGTMQTPWASIVGSRLVIGELADFLVTNGGTPDAGWYLAFEAGSRWLRGSFGLTGADFNWSLATFATGQSGRLGTVEVQPQGYEAVDQVIESEWDILETVSPAALTVSWNIQDTFQALTFIPPPVIDVQQGGSVDLADYTAGGYPPYTYSSSALPANVQLTGSILSAGQSAVVATSGDILFTVADSEPATNRPAWVEALPVMTWAQIPDTAIVDIAPPDPEGIPTNRCLAESGTGLKLDGSELFAFGGGHYDGSSNAVYSIRLEDAAPQWTMRRGPTQGIQWDVSHYPDGRPTSRHSYTQVNFLQSRNLLVFAGCSASFGAGTFNFNTFDAFDPVTNDWLPAGTFPNTLVTPPAATATVVLPNDDIITHYTGGQLDRWSNATGTYGQWSRIATTPSIVTNTAELYDPVRNRIVRLGDSRGVYDVDTGARTSITLTGAYASSIQRYGHAFYCDDLDYYLFFLFGRVTGAAPMTLYKIDPETWEVTLFAVAGDGPQFSANGTGQYSRVRYIPALRCVIALMTAEDIYVCRID